MQKHIVTHTYFAKRFFIYVTVLLSCLFFPACLLCQTQDREETIANPKFGDWIRLETNDFGTPTELATPAIRLEKSLDDEKRIVVLYGAIHFADPDYYAKLNHFFTQYDTVLVEMVLPKGKTLDNVTQNGRNDAVKIQGPLDLFALFQERGAKLLGLTSQLDAIDYGADNFLLADIDSETFVASFVENETFSDFFAKLASDLFAYQIDDEEAAAQTAEWLALLYARDVKLSAKRILARTLTEEITNGFYFEETLLHQRNRVVLERLKECLDRGDKKIAIFYGVAHLPELVEKIQSDFSFSETSRRWIAAWSMKP